MARFILSAIITLFSIGFANISEAQVNCDSEFGYLSIFTPQINFIPSVPPEAQDVYDFLWEFGDGESSTSSAPSHSYDVNGIYEVCLTVDYYWYCQSTTCKLIPITALGGDDCHAGFNFTSNACGAVTFSNISFSTGSQDFNFQWSFGDGSGSTETDPEHQYSQNGTYTVCVTIIRADGCTNTFCQDIVVDCFPPPCETFFQYTLGLCPEVLFFGANTTPPPTDWIWDFGDGSVGSGTNPSHVYAQNGSYTVCLTTIDASGCVAEHCETFIINCIQDCQTAFDYDLSTCPEVQFTGTITSPPPSTDTDWHWEFGDGTTGIGPNPIHTYTTNGTYTVCLVVTTAAGCTTTHCESIVIDCIPPTCAAFFQYTLGLCPEILFFGNTNTTPGPVIWDWDFGDGHNSSDQNPSHTYTSNGVYTVCLTITTTDGCVAEQCQTITINCIQDCQASFDYDLTDCPEVQFTGAVTAPPPSNVTDWQWSFGDGTSGTGPNPVHTYASNGTYTVCLTVTNPFGCSFTYCESIIISCVQPVCEAFYQYTLGNCPAVSFFDGSFANPGNVTSWFWNFGDGGNSTLQNPVHTYSANDDYEVCLTISSSDFCSATYCELITVQCVISSVEEVFGGMMEVYPNPVSAIAVVQFEQVHSEVAWYLSGVNGQLFSNGLMRHQSAFEVDMSDLAQGVYLLKMEIEGKSGFVKLIKQ